jgi:Putative lumazine-binding
MTFHSEVNMNRAAIVLGLALTAAAVGAALPYTSPDEQAIRQHIERHYFDGVRRSDTALAHRAFHPVAKMYFIRDGKLVERTIPDWLGVIAKNAPQPAQPDSFKRRVLEVDVSGNAAVAKLQLDYADAVIIDYMSLLKEGDQWRIVNKIFDRKPRSATSSR